MGQFLCGSVGHGSLPVTDCLLCCRCSVVSGCVCSLRNHIPNATSIHRFIRLCGDQPIRQCAPLCSALHRFAQLCSAGFAPVQSGAQRCTLSDRLIAAQTDETVESYTVVMLPTVIIIIISFPTPAYSFIPGLKPSFSANPSYCSLGLLCADVPLGNCSLTWNSPGLYCYF